MINGLICKVFHKKEVCVEDIVDTVKSVTILALPPAVSASFIYKYAFTDSYEGDLGVWCGLGIMAGMLATTITILYGYALIINLYDAHKKT